MKNKIFYALSLIAVSSLLFSFAGTASAAILFQDDTFATVESDAIQIGSNDNGSVNTAIQFGADATMSENGVLQWNIGTNTFSFDHTVDINGGLSATGTVDFSSAAHVNLRKNADPNTNSACSNLGEVIVNTTSNLLMICTAVGNPGTWVAASASNADTLDGLDSTQFLRSDTSTAYTSGTLTTNAGTTVDINGVLDASGATRFALPAGSSNPATCSVGDIFYNTTNNVLNVCTAANTWSAAGPQDFESIYATDADKTLTTGGTSFTVNSGGGNISNNTGTGTFNVTSSNTTAAAINLNASTGAGGITATAGSGGLNFSSATGAFNLSGAADSSLTTTGVSDITISAGDDIFFDDAKLTSAIKLTDTATGIAATYGTNGIIDALNSLTLTTAGNGASNVGIEAGSLTNVTPASNDVQAALIALDAKVGSGAPNVDTLVFNPEYPDAVIFRDGSNNQGTLSSDYDNTNNYHYYNWTTNQPTLQDIDLRFRFPLPTDFVSTGNFTGLYRTGTVNTSNNKVDFSVTNATDLTGGAPTTCASSTANASANAWATATLTAAAINTGCTGSTALNAGDIVQIIVKLYDVAGASTFAQAGTLGLAYNN